MSALEDAFAAAWRIDGRGTLVAEFEFCEGRKFRFDFANEASRVAVELEGGVFGRNGAKKCPACGQVAAGRHNTPMGFHDGCAKRNLASSLGWVIFTFTAKHLKDMPLQCVEMVSRAIQDRTPRTESKDGIVAA